MPKARKVKQLPLPVPKARKAKARKVKGPFAELSLLRNLAASSSLVQLL
jgi:hypothetical protein